MPRKKPTSRTAAPTADAATKPVRVPVRVYAELVTRQLAALKATGRRPTLGDILSQALGLT